MTQDDDIMTTKRCGNGRLMAYWEQGWEGRIEYGFEPDMRDASAGPCFIRNGDYLRIFSPDACVLWEGDVRLVPRRRWLLIRQQHDLGNDVWHDLTQAGVAYKDWIFWFWNGLRAEIVCK